MTTHNVMHSLLRRPICIVTTIAKLQRRSLAMVPTTPSYSHRLPESMPTSISPDPDRTYIPPDTIATTGPFAPSTMASPVSPISIPRNGVDYRSKIVLAPMVRSGELPSRLLALHYGADLVWGPETVDRAMIGTTRRINPRTHCIEWTRVSSNGGREDQPQKESIIYRIDPVGEKGKLIYQIGTSSPDLAVQAASLVASDVAGIDVNAGCPKPFSTSGGMGAALLQTPARLASILAALVENVGGPYEIGISVKIRLLETSERTSALVTTLCQTGITGLTVHCRTTPMRPRERAIRHQLRMVGSICRSHGVACLMNGDVQDRDEGVALAAEYGVDGGMIATAAESNSSAFRTREQGGLAPWREVVIEYLKLAMSVENKWGNTKFLLRQLIPGKEAVYKPVSMSKSHLECFEILGLDRDMLAQGREVDHILGVDVQIPKQIKRQLEDAANRKSQVAKAGEKKQKPEMARIKPVTSHSGFETFAGQIALAI